MAYRGCRNDPEKFCYICGELTLIKYRRNITDRIRRIYFAYFGCKIGDQDKPWAPHYCCCDCTNDLNLWFSGKKNSLKFAIPMIWREQKDHHTDCYFCITDIKGYTQKTKKNIQYPNLPSAIRPVSHSLELPVPKPPSSVDLDSIQLEYSHSDSDELLISEYDPEDSVLKPHLIEQGELNDLVRDLDLTKEKSEILASRLQQWNLLAPEVKVTEYRKRSKHLVTYFSTDGELCYCNDVSGLFDVLNIEYIAHDWRLFIDGSKESIKAVLLYNGNTLPSVPVAYSSTLKETYVNLSLILNKIDYATHQWYICADLKVVAILTGLQSGYTKYCCFLCLWDSRARQQHYVRKEWPDRQTMHPGQHNVQNVPLVAKEKVILPPLHIKLGAFKQFVKALKLKENRAVLDFLKEKFPALSEAKITEGVFVGPQIRKLVLNDEISRILTTSQLAAWNSFKELCASFLGKHRANNYQEIVANLIQNYHEIGCNMSLKLHFLDSHLDFFHERLADVSDEHGERFHQDIAVIERRYKGKKWTEGLLADYCWKISRDRPAQKHKRKTTKLNKV